MYVSRGRATTLIVLGVFTVMLGVGAVAAAIACKILSNSIENKYGIYFPAEAYTIGTLAIPLIIPGIIGIRAGVAKEVYSLQVAFLLLSLMSMVWLFVVAVVLWSRQTGMLSNYPYLLVRDEAEVYNMHVLKILAGLISFLGFIFRVATSMTGCCIMHKKDRGTAHVGAADTPRGAVTDSQVTHSNTDRPSYARSPTVLSISAGDGRFGHPAYPQFPGNYHLRGHLGYSGHPGGQGVMGGPFPTGQQGYPVYPPDYSEGMQQYPAGHFHTQVQGPANSLPAPPPYEAVPKTLTY